MKKLLILALLLSSLLAACSNNEEAQNIATFSHEVNQGYMYTDNEGNNIFIDHGTLESVGTTKQDKLSIKYYSNDFEVESVEVVRSGK